MDTSSSVVDLPDEIIELILSKCPIKSVLRFKSVSKSWQSIISDSRFSRIHRIQRSKLLEDQNMFLFWEDQRQRSYYGYGLHVMRLEEDEKFRTKSESLLLGYPSSGESFEPLCSCNGLILLCVDNKEYMLWNPLIRKHIIIPAFNPNTHRKSLRKWTAPKAHRYPRPHIYHDSVNEDYKIVFHYQLLRCYTVYSCRNGSWGEVKDFPVLDWKECVYGVDGSCLYGMRDGNTGIISFDARDERVHKFPLPEGVECLVKYTVKLEEASGRLYLYGFNNSHEKRFHLWVMEENGSFDNSWRKLISMEKKEPGIWRMRPVYLTNKDDVVLRAWSIIEDVKFVRHRDAHFIYNPHGNCTHKAINDRFNPHENCNFKLIDDHLSWDHNIFFPYSENLDMPYSNTPSSVPHESRKRRNDPTSCERRERPKKERHVF